MIDLVIQNLGTFSTSKSKLGEKNIMKKINGKSGKEKPLNFKEVIEWRIVKIYLSLNRN